ncbi:MAG TPA: hypothetical protein VGB17_02335 [Pyrinomonadaceae bacterium]|jgi:hypothetical protein
MLAHPLSRLAVLSLVLLSLVIAAGTRPQSAAINSPADDLIVHEWGTFTSVSGVDAQPLVWRPLNVESDLPSFVYSIDKGNSWRGLRYPSKSGLPVRVRMETPVIYFYAQQEMNVAVKVGFPNGWITEWYPQARTAGWGAIDWGQFKILPGASLDFPHDRTENHYYPARETDAAPVQLRTDQQTEQEKFLFYRGVGNFVLPLSFKLRGDKIVIANTGAQEIGKVVIFENRGGKTGYLLRDAPQGELEIERPTLDNKIDGLRTAIKAMLISRGLYQKEADAMLNTWRDSWFEEGLRVFYLMPRRTTDTILPLTIDPQPSQLVRLLVGRTELITPEMERHVIEQAAKLDDPSQGVREAALKEIKRYGRFTEPVLKQTLEHATDQKLRLRVERLLDEMEQEATRRS